MSSPDVALVSVYPGDGLRHAGSSGVASYTANLARALADAGADVRVLAAREPGAPTCSQDGAVRVERAFARGLGAGPAAVAAALRTGAPLVHLQFELFLYGASALPGVLAALAAVRGRRARTVVTAHQVVDPATVDGTFVRMHGLRLPPVLARGVLGSVQRAVGELPDAAVVHEDAFADSIPGAVVIPHGVEDVERTDGDGVRTRLGLDARRLVVLCFGFVAPYKGLELACEAALLAGDAVQIVVAGGEHPRHGRTGYAASLRARYAGAVRFAGFVPEDELASWFAAADLALLPYPRPHASSGALALALAYGTPVLLSPALVSAVGAASALGAAAEPAQLATQLRGLAADPEKRSALRDASACLAEGRSWPEVARRHLELYREVIDAHPAAAGRPRAV